MSGVLDLNEISDNIVVRSYCGKRNSDMFIQSNPLSFIDSTDTFPLLAIHGTKDGLAPLSNIINFTDSLEFWGIQSDVHIVKGAHLETCAAWYYDSYFNKGQIV